MQAVPHLYVDLIQELEGTPLLGRGSLQDDNTSGFVIGKNFSLHFLRECEAFRSSFFLQKIWSLLLCSLHPHCSLSVAVSEDYKTLKVAHLPIGGPQHDSRAYQAAKGRLSLHSIIVRFSCCGTSQRLFLGFHFSAGTLWELLRAAQAAVPTIFRVCSCLRRGQRWKRL